MSQTTEEFIEGMQAAKEDLLRRGRRSGPTYGEYPLVWHDQVFGREIATTAATVTCKTPLRVGSTNNRLDVALVASNSNTQELKATSGATITLELLSSDSPDGTFTSVGPSYCVTAPAEGITAEPDALFVRFPLGNIKKPWLKAKLTFTGSITGGKVDCVLALMPA